MDIGHMADNCYDPRVPKVVDHDERRQMIVAACWRVVARYGLAGATIRQIAREAGVSHGVLAHYFPDKDAILTQALQVSYEELKARILTVTATRTGAAALRAVLVEALPTDPRDHVGEKVELALWAKAAADPVLAAHRRRTFLEWTQGLRRLVTDAQDRGELDATADAGSVADVLAAFVDGLGAQVALYPDQFPARRQVRALDELLRGVGLDLAGADDPP
jgi:AcrR family transcriptional regulator